LTYTSTPISIEKTTKIAMMSSGMREHQGESVSGSGAAVEAFLL